MKKFIWYGIWIALIIIGAIARAKIPTDMLYSFGFAIGSFSMVAILIAKSSDDDN